MACTADHVEEIASLGDTLASWRTEILAHHTQRRQQRPYRGPEPAREEGEALRSRLQEI